MFAAGLFNLFNDELFLQKCAAFLCPYVESNYLCPYIEENEDTPPLGCCLLPYRAAVICYHLVEYSLPSGARLVYHLVRKTLPKGTHTRPAAVSYMSKAPALVSTKETTRGRFVFVRLFAWFGLSYGYRHNTDTAGGCLFRRVFLSSFVPGLLPLLQSLGASAFVCAGFGVFGKQSPRRLYRCCHIVRRV